MLDTYYSVLAESPGGKDKGDLQTNWLDVKGDLVELIEYRLSTSQCYWYNETYLSSLSIIDRFTPQESSSINLLPQGLLGEVFFLNACKQNDIQCEPSFGGEDIKGMDFKLADSHGEKFIDVTINTKQNSVRRKIQAGSIPTVFLPWTYKKSNNGHLPISYANHYLECGGFDGREFLSRVLDINYSIVDCLTKEVLRDEKVSRKKIAGRNYTDFSGSNVEYIYDMEEVLYMIGAPMESTQFPFVS